MKKGKIRKGKKRGAKVYERITICHLHFLKAFYPCSGRHVVHFCRIEQLQYLPSACFIEPGFTITNEVLISSCKVICESTNYNVNPEREMFRVMRCLPYRRLWNHTWWLYSRKQNCASSTPTAQGHSAV